jgi:hypothetical protein
MIQYLLLYVCQRTYVFFQTSTTPFTTLILFCAPTVALLPTRSIFVKSILRSSIPLHCRRQLVRILQPPRTRKRNVDRRCANALSAQTARRPTGARIPVGRGDAARSCGARATYERTRYVTPLESFDGSASPSRDAVWCKRLIIYRNCGF